MRAETSRFPSFLAARGLWLVALLCLSPAAADPIDEPSRSERKRQDIAVIRSALDRLREACEKHERCKVRLVEAEKAAAAARKNVEEVQRERSGPGFDSARFSRVMNENDPVRHEQNVGRAGMHVSQSRGEIGMAKDRLEELGEEALPLIQERLAARGGSAAFREALEAVRGRIVAARREGGEGSEEGASAGGDPGRK